MVYERREKSMKMKQTEKEIDVQTKHIKKLYTKDIEQMVAESAKDMIKEITMGDGIQGLVKFLYQTVGASFQLGYQAHIEELEPKEEKK